MTTPELEPEILEPESSAEVDADLEEISATPRTEEEEDRRRRWLLLLLLLLLVCLCCVGGLFLRYLLKPQPLPDMIAPQVSGCYAPSYKFSIKGLDGPVSVAISPDEQRIYVAESKGERLVKILDRDGNFIASFSPPGTDKANREPKFLTIAPDGRVFLVERTSNSIQIYTADGQFIDAIIGQQMTLSKYLAGKIGALPKGTVLVHYEGINHILTYSLPNGVEQDIKIEFPADSPACAPLGVRFDKYGNLIYTDITSEDHSVRIIPAIDLGITSKMIPTPMATSTGTLLPTATATATAAPTATPLPGAPTGANVPLVNFNPQIRKFGTYGKGNGQFDFPQIALQDSRGNYYVSDGNNTRISQWTPDMQYKTFFGFGSTDGALNLPRGLWIDKKDCLIVADAVGSLVRGYDISGNEPLFSYSIGGFGVAEGQFNYPMDVIIDGTGRLYIADRENYRIQVWSY
jgi:DNA-binding beta-propeller fold protein YncE